MANLGNRHFIEWLNKNQVDVDYNIKEKIVALLVNFSYSKLKEKLWIQKYGKI